jgi:hypothetical protein
MSTKPNQPNKPAKPVVCSLTLGYDYSDDADMSLNPCIRALATISNHYGELGSAAEFLRKAAQIRDVLERPDDPFPIRIFARQDADDVLDASDPSEWLEVDVVEETEPSRGEVLRRFKQVLCRSQALFEEKPKKDCDPAPRLESRAAR